MNSKLQIISGRFRGRKLYLPPNARPTQNRARAALFNMLASGIIDVGANIMVWDACAGSGAFGIECLSRYPNARAVFTDTDTESIKTVKRNLGMLNIGVTARVENIDAIAAVPQFGPDADLIFVDAPYDMANIGAVFVDKLTRVVRDGAILVWEQEVGHPAPVPDGWRILRDKGYGRARFLIAVREKK